MNLAAWAAPALTSVPMALVGVKVAHFLDRRRFKPVFIIVMLYMGHTAPRQDLSGARGGAV